MTERRVSTSRALRRILAEAPALRRGLGVTVALAAVGTAIQIVVPVVVQRIVDHEILAPGGVDVGGTLVLGGVALAAMAVAMVVRRAALTRLAIRAAEGLSDLRVKTFAHLHSLSVLHVQAERRGSLVSRVTSDVVAIQDFVDWGGVGMLIGAAQVVLAIVAMLIYQWKLALLVLGGVVVYAAMLVWFQRILQRLHDQVRRRVGDTLAALSEAISGLPVVRAYGGEDATVAKVERVIEQELETEVRTFTVGAALFSSAEVFAGTITAAVIVVGVLTGVTDGTSAGTLLAMLFLVNLLVEPVQTLVETLDQAQSAAAGVRRITSVLDTEVDVPDPADGVNLPDGALDVRLDHVRFRYPTGGDVLVDLSAHIPAGARVAVVGETGSGKSTFAKLVTRLLDPAEAWSPSAEHRSPASASRVCVSTWCSCPRRAFSSTPRWRTTCVTGGQRRPTKTSPRHSVTSPSMIGSSRSPTGPAPGSANVADSSPQANASSSPWPGRGSPAPACSFSTRPRPPSTRRWRFGSAGRSTASSRAGRRSPSPTACRRPRRAISCWCSTGAGWSNEAPTRS
jgi:ATP-binding cassette, subfamily B, bacterial